MTADKTFLTIEDVSERWGISIRQVRRMLHNQQLIGVKIAGKWRIRPKDVLACEKEMYATTDKEMRAARIGFI